MTISVLPSRYRVMVQTLLAGLWLLLAVSTADAFDAIIDADGGKIHLYIEDDAYRLSMSELTVWVERSVNAVTLYYGGFPLEEAYVAVSGRSGKGVLHGIAMGEVGAVVNVKIGLSTDSADLMHDWVLVHELIHLTFPKMHRRHHWIEEGLSVYVESIARAQAGDISAESVWDNFVRGMPHGLPQPGDRGLDYTPSWGRTYWGGALFFLLADIKILQRSGGEKSLRDGLRALVASGYSILQRSEPRHLFTIADRAVGHPVLTEFYDEMGKQSVDIDLAKLWRDLGIVYAQGKTSFSDQARLADIRRVITQASN